LNVTEDADLGMRCSALGYRVEVVDSVTRGAK
jgi:cellulose synthase/poly-beta-1,6-N-acetylglucosamine synthase-like glycosyltransferase